MKKINFTVLLISKFISRYFKKVMGILQNRKNRSFDSPKNINIRKRYLLFSILTVFFVVIGIKLSLNPSLNALTSEGFVGVYTAKTLPPTVANLLSEPLVILDDTGRPRPHLAVSWQVNNNATVYTFMLKKDLMWNDGTKVKSSDLKFGIPDVEVLYPNEETVEFKLTESFSAFPSLLTSPILKNGSLIGVGKYEVGSLSTSRNLVTKLVLHPADKEKSDLPTVVIRFYPDERTAKTAFKLGEVESLIGITEIEDFVGQPMIFLKKVPNFSKLVAVFYQYNDKILSDKNFRKALSAATPVIGGEEQAKTSLPPRSWAFNSQIKELVGNKELAKSYFKKVQSGADSVITLTTTPTLVSVGERIVQAWKEIGISAVLRVESGAPQNFQALLTAQPIPLDPDQYALWHSTQTLSNITKYNSPRVDKDLEDGRKTADWEKRKEKYLDFQKTLLEDSPATFLYFPQTNIIYRQTAEKNINKILPLQLPVLDS